MDPVSWITLIGTALSFVLHGWHIHRSKCFVEVETEKD